MLLPGPENPAILWLNIVSIFVILVALFFATRAFWLWYFRLGQMADDIRYIAQFLRKYDSSAQAQDFLKELERKYGKPPKLP